MILTKLLKTNKKGKVLFIFKEVKIRSKADFPPKMKEIRKQGQDI